MTQDPSKNVQRAELLKQLEDILMLGLKMPIKALFSKADDRLFDLSQSCRNPDQQDLYLQTMKAVRVQQPTLMRSYFSLVQQKIALPDDEGDLDEDWSLVSHDELQVQVMLGAMANHAVQLYGPLLTELNARIASLLDTEGHHIQNPFSPRVLAGLFSEIPDELGLDVKGQEVLLKLFDDMILTQLEPIYQRMNSLLLEAGIAEKALQELERPTEQPQQAQQKPVGEGAEALLAQLAKVLGAQKMQQIKADMGVASSHNPSSQIRGIEPDYGAASDMNFSSEFGGEPAPAFAQKGGFAGNDFEEQPPFMADDVAAGQHQEQQAFLDQFEAVKQDQEARFKISQLVANLFQLVLGDGQLAEPLQLQLARLKRPYVEVALKDGRFLIEENHPARQLLNTLAQDSVSWHPIGAIQKDRFYKKLCSVVEQVEIEHSDNGQVFEQQLLRWQKFNEAEKKRARLLEQRMLEVEEGKARAEKARQQVDECLVEKLMGKQLPESIVKLVRDPWANVMFLISLRDGIGSEAWNKALETVDQLLWSVQPHEAAANREKLLNIMPGLLKELRLGLTDAGVNPSQMNKVFSELETIHMTALRPDAARKLAETHANNDALDTPAAHDQANISEQDLESLEEKYLLLVDNISTGTWVELEIHEEPVRCKLAAYLKPTKKYIFVNRAGAKAAEFSKEELAMALQMGRMKLLEDAKLFDRALEDVIGGLRNIR